jgi:formyltetrahydrofolate synthetase
VITSTMRALKMHGGLPADAELLKAENDQALTKGCENLAKQIENMKYFGVPVVVTINRFAFDRDTEVEIVRREARAAGAEDAVPINVHALGGDGGQEAAEVVRAAADKGGEFRFLYPLDASIKEKIETIATKIYGADGVDYLPEAEAKIEQFTKQGLDKLPLCMAKTHLSLSHDPALKGRPRGFRVPIRDIRPATGAGYLYPLLGEMRTMPGLPKRPAAVDVDIDVKTGRIIGLF